MWAGGSLAIDEGPLEALVAWGASPDVIAEWRRDLLSQAKQHAVEIWPEHWHAWCVFDGMATQWRATGDFGGIVRTGLDYGALPIVLAEHRGNPHRRPLPELMPQLRILEAAALEQYLSD